ncbi:570_t:CDS:2, partial [Gigaspora margarita]
DDTDEIENNTLSTSSLINVDNSPANLLFSISKIPKFESLILHATVSAALSNCILMSAANEVQVSIKELACKDEIGDDMASDDDLQLPDDIKVIINCDSFWDSLAML